MANSRITYANQLVCIGPTGNWNATGVHTGSQGQNLVVQLNRVQSVNYNWSQNRTDVNQYGMMAAVEQVNLDVPVVPLSFSYLLANFWNEDKLGFTVNGNLPALSGLLAKQTDEKNYFIKVSNEGVDSISGAGVTTVGVGNGFVTSYSSTAAVGGLPTVTVNVEGSNLQFQQGASGSIPALNPTNGQQINNIFYTIPTGAGNIGTGDLAISVLRPGDLTISVYEAGTSNNFNEMGVNLGNTNIQSYTLAFNIGRDPIHKLGSRHAVDKPIKFPINATLDVETIPGSFTTGSLFSTLCDDTEYDISISLRVPNCSGGGNTAAQYLLKKCKLNGVDYAGNIGSNESAKLSLTSQIGSTATLDRGLFLSGVYI